MAGAAGLRHAGSAPAGRRREPGELHETRPAVGSAVERDLDIARPVSRWTRLGVPPAAGRVDGAARQLARGARRRSVGRRASAESTARLELALATAHRVA